ncbi:MAG: HD domain-containing protein [Pirellulaceae bacterium]
MPDNDELLNSVRELVHARMSGQGAGHDWDHVVRVLRTSEKLAAEVDADRFIVRLAALLHDIGDAKFHDGQEKSGEFSHEILAQVGVDSTTREAVIHIVENLSFRKREVSEELTLEGQVVQDADRLDALGAIGIVRTIEFGAWKQQPFYRRWNDADSKGSDNQPTGVGHFAEKLLRLRATLNTEPAREIALEREQFMRTFLTQYFAEIGEALPSDLANFF